MRNGKIQTPDGIKFGQPEGLAQVGEGLLDIDTNQATFIDKNTAKQAGGSGKPGVDDVAVGGSYNGQFDSTWIPSHELGIDKIVAKHLKHVETVNKAQEKVNKSYKMSSLSNNTAKLMSSQLNKYVDENITPWRNLQSKLNEEREMKETRKFDVGWLGRNYAGLAGTAASMAQLGYFVNQKPTPTNTHASNIYAPAALRGLGNLSYSPDSRLRAARDSMRKSLYGISQAGALTPAQKYIVQTKMALDNSKLNSDIIADAQDKNIGLRSAYYNALLQAGEHDAQRAQAARQYDTSRMDNLRSMYNKNLVTSIGSGVQSLYQMAADDNKWRQFRDTISIYRDDLNDKKAARAAEIAQRQEELALQRQQATNQYVPQNRLYYNPRQPYNYPRYSVDDFWKNPTWYNLNRIA